MEREEYAGKGIVVRMHLMFKVDALYNPLKWVWSSPFHDKETEAQRD